MSTLFKRFTFSFFISLLAASPLCLDASVTQPIVDNGYATTWSEDEINARIGDLQRAINNYLHQAEQAERDARRLAWRDRGYSMHLRNRADWLRGRADEAQREIQYLQSLKRTNK